ncbi:hypothetical protein VE03_06860 [Pseudogymnoascus sp. 23342-1-I1]|nr:hypothetical protein VE03_06860 [Pseudogymnoascus sp. 23342-1-I1]
MPSKGPSPNCAAEPYDSNKYPLDIGPGCIMWLPENYRPRPGSTLCEPPAGATNHPIVVLSVTVTGIKDAIVFFTTLTSFSKDYQNNATDRNNCVDISKHGYKGQYVKVLRFVPEKKKTAISPPPLTLEHRYERKLQLEKTSFVDLGAVYSAQLADLRVYNPKWGPQASLLRLDEESFSYVWERINGNACGMGGGAAWTWVPTKQLRSDFAKCAKRREETLRASAMTTMSARSGINHLICLLLHLSRTTDSIFATPSSRLGGFSHHLLLHCAGLAAALAASEETTTTREETDAVTSTSTSIYVVSAVAIAMISRRLSSRLAVGARRSRSVDRVFAEVMADAVLLAGIVYAGLVAKRSAETRGSPAQTATMSMPAGMNGPGGQEEEGWTRVTNRRRH